jgi:hypothetical protein
MSGEWCAGGVAMFGIAGEKQAMEMTEYGKGGNCFAQPDSSRTLAIAMKNLIGPSELRGNVPQIKARRKGSRRAHFLQFPYLHSNL